MTEASLSIVIGTAGLSLACLASILLAYLRLGISAEYVHNVRIWSGIALGFQLMHFTEEYYNQFYVRFPELLGLRMWPREFFLVFNFGWLLVWTMAVVGVAKFPRASTFPLWFLGIASVLNGVTHPAISIVSAAYFPGLWTSLFVGFSGFILVGLLIQATNNANFRTTEVGNKGEGGN